jgi:hypothetical protein
MTKSKKAAVGAAPISDFTPDAVMLRTCDRNGKAYGNFQWPLTVGEMVAAPDWNDREECGGGLHGLIGGLGDWGHLSTDHDAKWMICAIMRSEAVAIGVDKIKVPRCRVDFIGSRAEAFARIPKTMFTEISRTVAEAVKDVEKKENTVSTTGYGSAAATTGYGSAAATTGYGSAAATTGYGSAAATTGNRSAAATTGNRSAAATTGNRSAAATTGDGSAASALGKNAIAAALGSNARAKSNTAIVLARYDDDWNVTHVFAGMVDGVTIKGDTWYELDANGTPVEVDGDQ